MRCVGQLNLPVQVVSDKGSQPRQTAVLGDKAQSSRAIRSHLRGGGIEAVIPEPRDQQGRWKGRCARDGTPVRLDADDHKNRNVIERRFRHIEQWRAMARLVHPIRQVRDHLPRGLGALTTVGGCRAVVPPCGEQFSSGAVWVGLVPGPG